MPKEDMDSPMGFILALESSMKGEKMDSEDAPVEKPKMAKSDGPDPKEDKAPEDMGDKKERAVELFLLSLVLTSMKNLKVKKCC